LKETINNSLFQTEELLKRGLTPIKGILISGFSGAGKSAILKKIKRDFAFENPLIFWKGISSV